MIDPLGAIVPFCVFLPVFLVFPLLIWLADWGPVLYGHQCVGRNGKLLDLTSGLCCRLRRERLVESGHGRKTPALYELDHYCVRAGSTNFLSLSSHLGEMSLVAPGAERPKPVTASQRDAQGAGSRIA